MPPETDTSATKKTVKKAAKKPAKKASPKPAPKPSVKGDEDIVIKIVETTPRDENGGPCYKPGTRLATTRDEIESRGWPADCYKIITE